MDKGSILVKEVCKKNSCVCDFEAILHTKAPLKEIYEIRHQILRPKVMVGKNAAALFGKILIKAYGTKSEDLELFLTEQIISYKGFILDEFTFHHKNPLISIHSKLEGIFTEIIDPNKIKVTGIISTELLFFLEKAIHLSQLEYPQNDTSENSFNDLVTLNHPQDDKAEDYSVYSMEPNAETYGVSSEIHTEVEPGTSQEFTIILD